MFQSLKIQEFKEEIHNPLSKKEEEEVWLGFFLGLSTEYPIPFPFIAQRGAAYIIRLYQQTDHGKGARDSIWGFFFGFGKEAVRV